MALWDYKWVILFYGAIILLLYIYRKRFDSQGALIKLYRTKLGLKYMDKIGLKHPRIIQTLATIGIYVGYLGMAVIIVFIFYGVYQIIFVPDAPPPLQPVIPGVPIPGSPIQVPLITGWIALFLSAVIHEFSHGVVARAYKIKVKSSGFAFIGPLAAAFVEPDEKQVEKAGKKVQNSIFAAGPFSNVLLAILMILLLTFVLTPLINAYLTPSGFSFQQVQVGYPAEQAGITSSQTYISVNGEEVLSAPAFFTSLENLTPGEPVLLGTEESTYTIISTQHPDNSSKGYIGVMGPTTVYTNEKTALATILLYIAHLFNWIFIISLGLGLANLLPLGPVDGGRLFQTAALFFFGEKKGMKIWKYTTFIFIAIIIILFFPIIKATLIAIAKGLHII